MKTKTPSMPISMLTKQLKTIRTNLKSNHTRSRESMFATNQILKISGQNTESDIKNALMFALNKTEKHEPIGWCISEDNKFYVGYTDIPSTDTEPTSYDNTIINTLVNVIMYWLNQHALLIPENQTADKTYTNGFFMQTADTKFTTNNMNKTTFHAILTFEPFINIYRKDQS